MIVSDPDHMERIVSRHRNLVWEGWDVLKISRNPIAMYYKDGRFIKGRWHRTRRFALTRQGWDIPDEFLRS